MLFGNQRVPSGWPNNSIQFECETHGDSITAHCRQFQIETMCVLVPTTVVPRRKLEERVLKCQGVVEPAHQILMPLTTLYLLYIRQLCHFL